MGDLEGEGLAKAQEPQSPLLPEVWREMKAYENLIESLECDDCRALDAELTIRLVDFLIDLDSKCVKTEKEKTLRALNERKLAHWKEFHE